MTIEEGILIVTCLAFINSTIALIISVKNIKEIENNFKIADRKLDIIKENLL